MYKVSEVGEEQLCQVFKKCRSLLYRYLVTLELMTLLMILYVHWPINNQKQKSNINSVCVEIHERVLFLESFSRDNFSIVATFLPTMSYTAELFRFEGEYGQKDLVFRVGPENSELEFTGPVVDPSNIPETTVWKIPRKLQTDRFVTIPWFCDFLLANKGAKHTVKSFLFVGH